MKKLVVLALLVLAIAPKDSKAQEPISGEKYGNTINLGIGIGYYGYVGYNTPVLHFDYEIGIIKNLTIAPSISVYQYHRDYYWGNKNYPYRYYTYTETVIPIGAKVTYYFDELLKANKKWDFYVASTLAFKIRKTVWESDYYGDKIVQNRSSALYVDMHVGAEYHMNNRAGLFLDLSTGVSTFGLAIHL